MKGPIQILQDWKNLDKTALEQKVNVASSMASENNLIWGYLYII